MQITKLTLHNWCQHDRVCLQFPRVPLMRLIGANNMGKTNIIRAIGRVLAQGRSEFGDASDIQHGAEEAMICLEAETADGLPFTLQRWIRQRTQKAVLNYPGLSEPMQQQEQIKDQLCQWFGPLDTLLALMIAPQGQIDRLLRVSGKKRLEEFIRLCGFQEFLQKQRHLDSFIRELPLLPDISGWIQAHQHNIQHLETCRQQLQKQLEQLPGEVSLRQCLQAAYQRQAAWKSRQERIQQQKKCHAELRVQLEKAPPDPTSLEQECDQLWDKIQKAQQCLNYSNYLHWLKTRQQAEAVLASLPSPGEPPIGQIQEINRQWQLLQEKLGDCRKKQSRIQEIEAQRQRLQHDLERLRQRCQTLGMPERWLQLDIAVFQQLQEHTHRVLQTQKQLQQETCLLQNMGKLQVPTQSLENHDILAAQLRQFEMFEQAARQAEHECPLCRQSWPVAQRQQRQHELAQEKTRVQHLLAEWSGLRTQWEHYHQKTSQVEQQKMRCQQAQNEHDAACQQQQAWIQQHGLDNAAELLPVLFAEYSQLRQILVLPDILGHMDQEIQREKQQLQSLQETELHDEKRRLENQLNALQQQQQSWEQQQLQRDRWRQQAELARQILDKMCPPLKPDMFDENQDYTTLLNELQRRLETLRPQCQALRKQWQAYQDVVQRIKALEQEIDQLLKEDRENPWTQEDQASIIEWEQQLALQQQLQQKYVQLGNQMETLRMELQQYQQQQQRREQQMKQVDLLRGVSRFLSYDQGPARFLHGFFQDVLTCTNDMLSDMGMPVYLKLEEELEIKVVNHRGHATSSQALGGGYGNIIAVLMRIALQRKALRNVHTLILDEPTTHVDEERTDMLLNLLANLQNRFAGYGIQQCVIIDHHPAWKQLDIPEIKLEQLNIQEPRFSEEMLVDS